MSAYALSAGIGGALIVPLLARSITVFGWRTTAVFCGLSYWIIGGPLLYIIKNKPEDIVLLPDNMSIPSSDVDPKKVTVEDLGLEVNITAAEALRSRTFWTLMIAESFRSFLLGSVVIHQIPYLISIGINQETAAAILGMMIILSIPGRIIFGSAGDYYYKKHLLTIVMGFQAIGILFFSRAMSILNVYAFVLIYGLGYGGTIPLLMSYRGELFGRRRYATITGLLAPFRMIGSVVGPIFAGYIFDIYESYRLAFYVFTVLALLSSLTFQLVRPLEEQ